MKLLKMEIKIIKEEIKKIGLAFTDLIVRLDDFIKNNKNESSFNCELCDYNASSATVFKSHMTRTHK